MMGWLFADIMNSLGLPKGVLNYVVASGAESGDYLVQHPKLVLSLLPDLWK